MKKHGMSFSKHSLNLNKKTYLVTEVLLYLSEGCGIRNEQTGVNVPCNVAVPGKRRVAMEHVASLLSGVNG